MTETIFKIRNKAGAFSRGGMDPKFDKKGKVWRGLGPLKNHLNVVRPDSRGRNPYEDCEIIKIIVSYEEAEVTPVATLLAEQRQKALDKQRARDEAARKLREAREKETLRTLQKKYGTNP